MKHIIFAIFSFLITVTANAEMSLSKAVLSGDIQQVQNIINNGADINAIDSDSFRDETPLFLASKKGNARIVQFLLSNGADHSIKAISGATPLRIAVQKGHIDVVNLLLKAKADPKKDTDEYGRSPIVWAFLYARKDPEKYSKIINLLHNSGADCPKSFTNPSNGKEIILSDYASINGVDLEKIFKKECKSSRRTNGK